VPEVAGDAVLSVNPYEAREIAEGIQALDRDEQLRNELSERGRKRAQLFSEAAYRDRLAAVYEKVLSNHGA
jgi:glycosyltransferase involved in cell wall biosynthesis